MESILLFYFVKEVMPIRVMEKAMFKCKAVIARRHLNNHDFLGGRTCQLPIFQLNELKADCPKREIQEQRAKLNMRPEETISHALTLLNFSVQRQEQGYQIQARRSRGLAPLFQRHGCRR
jgi:hypothetical protein